MSDLFVSNNRHSVLIMQNKKFFIIILLAVFISMTSQAKEPILMTGGIESIADQLISPDEAQRFKVLEKAKEKISEITLEKVESLLTSLRQKNVSTLIFVLMETKSDLLYHLSPPAQTAVENSTGSFPNIAYYYARINHHKGLAELYRLYGRHKDQRIYICKAIGETGSSEAAEFLMSEAKKEKESGKNIIPMLAGLRVSNKAVGENNILWFLEQNLDREEIILLSDLKAGFAQKALIRFYNDGGIKAAYAIQFLFRDPVANFEAIRSVVDKELENKQYDKVLQWMMSDVFERIGDSQLKKYRESVLESVRKKM